MTGNQVLPTVFTTGKTAGVSFARLIFFATLSEFFSLKHDDETSEAALKVWINQIVILLRKKRSK